MDTSTLLFDATRKITRAAEMRREADVLEAEGRGMMAVLQALGIENTGSTVNSLATPPPAILPPNRGGGRQPGGLSRRWQEILSNLYQRENGFSDEDVIEEARQNGLANFQRRDATRQLIGYLNYKFVERASDGRYYVSSKAAHRFGFHRQSVSGADSVDQDADTEEGPGELSPGPSSMNGVKATAPTNAFAPGPRRDLLSSTAMPPNLNPNERR